MFYGVLDLQGRRLRYANAGLFPFPFLKERDTAVFLECPGRPLGLPGRGGSISAGELDFPDSARLLVATDGVLELGAEAPQRQKREEVRLAFEQSEGIDALVRRLGLVDGASLRDDVAILYVGASEAPQSGTGGKVVWMMADGRVTYSQQQGWHVLHYSGKVDYTLAPAIDRFVDGCSMTAACAPSCSTCPRRASSTARTWD